jgi:hypothetical protein
LIEVLDRHQVEYLIVGGAAAVAYGAERPTEDADCVVSRDTVNLVRLANALRELNESESAQLNCARHSLRERVSGSGGRLDHPTSLQPRSSASPG